MICLVSQNKNNQKKGLACSSYTICSKNSKMNSRPHAKPNNGAHGLSTPFWPSSSRLHRRKPQTCCDALTPSSALPAFDGNPITGSWRRPKFPGNGYGDAYGK